MPLEYKLIKLASGAGNSRIARVEAGDVVSEEELLDLIASRLPDQERETVETVLRSLTEVIAVELSKGRRIVTPFACYGTAIRGVFPGNADKFDPERHKLVPTIRTGAALEVLTGKAGDRSDFKIRLVGKKKPEGN